MQLSVKDALNIFGLKNTATLDEIKASYRKACGTYHPDKNPAGLEMMKLVNVAHDILKDHIPNCQYNADSRDVEDAAVEMYGEKMNDALNLLISLGLEIEICGMWIWVHGDSYPHREILKEHSFKWAPVKKLWYFRPENYKSCGRGKWDMDKIREAHGSQKIKNTRKNVAYAA